jgi:prephenate dehydrogenase
MILQDLTVSLVGLGQMGGSLGLALRSRARVKLVIGVARRPEALEQAKALGAIDEGTLDLASGMKDADLAVLATPVRGILSLIPEVGPLMKPGSILTDLGSTKVDILQAMEGLPLSLSAIGGHPMCGNERSGLEAASVDCYLDAPFVLAPRRGTPTESLALLETVVTTVGARPMVLDPGRHDRLVAAVSHLPYLLACALVSTAGEAASRDPLAWELAADSFRDTSRVASSSVAMAGDFCLTNKESISETVQSFQTILSWMASELERDPAAFLSSLEQARRLREKWVQEKEGK